jgi:hypothetical protein
MQGEKTEYGVAQYLHEVDVASYHDSLGFPEARIWGLATRDNKHHGAALLVFLPLFIPAEVGRSPRAHVLRLVMI